MERLIIIAILTQLLAACGDQHQFAAGNTKAEATADIHQSPAPSPAAVPLTEEQFDIASIPTKIDMIWVIDNSGSMSDKIAKVRQNFTTFLDSARKSVDLNLALVSRSKEKDATFGFSLSPADIQKGYIQVDSAVGSTNLLAVLSAALCPASSTVNDWQSTNSKICGAKYTDTTVFDTVPFFESWTKEENDGKLEKFLRKDGVPVLVFVTDDNSYGIDSKNFLKVTKSAFIGASPVTFAFAGTSRSTCTISTAGASYADLATQSGGKVFELCDATWNANFTTLLNNTTQIKQNVFKLKVNDKFEIVEIKVDGLALKAADYVIKDGGSIEISRDKLANGAKKISVKYKGK